MDTIIPMRLFLCSVLVIFLLPSANAVTITPTHSQYEAGGVRYFFTVSNWGPNDGGQSWCHVSGGEGYPVCKILIGARNIDDWTVTVAYQWGPLSGGGPTPAASMGDLYKEMTKYGFSVPFKGSVLKTVPPERPTCISFARVFSQTNGAGGGIVPIGDCVAVVKPQLKCEISGNATISHNNVDDNNINNSTASTQLIAKCTDVSAIYVSLLNYEQSGLRLRKEGNLHSKITINDRDAAESPLLFSIDQALNLNIKSQLVGKGAVEPGPFSGAAVLRITAP